MPNSIPSTRALPLQLRNQPFPSKIRPVKVYQENWITTCFASVHANCALTQGGMVTAVNSRVKVKKLLCRSSRKPGTKISTRRQVLQMNVLEIMFGTRAYMKITSTVPFLKSYKPITEVEYNTTCFSRIRNLITGQLYVQHCNK